MTWRVQQGDCLEVMAGMESNSVDAIVTDPPYGINFMAKTWDDGRAIQNANLWSEALRLIKPGGHLVAFGATRAYHRTMCAIEDAGWVLRDTLSWLYGTGAPKGLNVSKAFDEAAGHNWRDITEPITDEAKEWNGYGTGLSPAWEPIILARKPLNGSVIENVRAHRTGVLNIDGCRGETDEQHRTKCHSVIGLNSSKTVAVYGRRNNLREDSFNPLGRWPTNVLLDEGAAKSLGDKARYFYTAKASAAERDAGMGGFEMRPAFGKMNSANGTGPRLDGAPTPQRANHHPTVKPISLMKWLCTLICPPGGVILDPFTGSGSTGCAARIAGFQFEGIELNPEYVEIARARIAHWDPDHRLLPKETPPGRQMELL